MNTCGTCTHWQAPGGEDWRNTVRLARLPGESLRELDAREHRAEALFGECQAITMLDTYGKQAEPLPLAYTRDASDYRADLFTQAEFGCSLWEAK